MTVVMNVMIATSTGTAHAGESSHDGEISRPTSSHTTSAGVSRHGCRNGIRNLAQKFHAAGAAGSVAKADGTVSADTDRTMSNLPSKERRVSIVTATTL
jgi:hypothetical protein